MGVSVRVRRDDGSGYRRGDHPRFPATDGGHARPPDRRRRGRCVTVLRHDWDARPRPRGGDRAVRSGACLPAPGQSDDAAPVTYGREPLRSDDVPGEPGWSALGSRGDQLPRATRRVVQLGAAVVAAHRCGRAFVGRTDDVFKASDHRTTISGTAPTRQPISGVERASERRATLAAPAPGRPALRAVPEPVDSAVDRAQGNDLSRHPAGCRRHLRRSADDPNHGEREPDTATTPPRPRTPTTISPPTSTNAPLLHAGTETRTPMTQAATAPHRESPRPPRGTIPLLFSRAVDWGDKRFHKLWITLADGRRVGTSPRVPGPVMGARSRAGTASAARGRTGPWPCGIGVSGSSHLAAHRPGSGRGAAVGPGYGRPAAVRCEDGSGYGPPPRRTLIVQAPTAQALVRSSW